MNKFNVLSLIKKFPGLKHAGNPQAVGFISVRKTDQRVMESTPHQTRIIGPKQNVHEGDRVLLFDAGHNLLGEVKPHVYYVDHVEDIERVDYGNTVLEQLFLDRIQDKVHYFIWVRFGYEVMNLASTPTWQATVYLPQEDQLDAWLEDACSNALRLTEAMAA